MAGRQALSALPSPESAPGPEADDVSWGYGEARALGRAAARPEHELAALGGRRRPAADAAGGAAERRPAAVDAPAAAAARHGSPGGPARLGWAEPTGARGGAGGRHVWRAASG